MSSGVTQPPLPPEIEGYLHKMKRSWNRRWFYVDKKHKEFGYSVSNTQPRMKNSIFLNDITAVIAFDEYCFQVESKTRKFFLKAESKTSAACWVKTLERYRTQQLLYEKHLASTPIASAKHNGPEETSPARDAKETSKRNNQKHRAEERTRSRKNDSKPKRIHEEDDLSTPVQAWSMESDSEDDTK
ncbi:hypothetical protein THRCLA_22335 [Thraustotheca clavata]|uniref:PH domain-containing protein n=1 Tax=Thraustotheca clavata TaxID=74557 RepID=A0A1V9Z5R8_9STRA|nr:hypothetical protein THRCLA_22335 [Thraustotheca clavata]